MRRTTLWIGGSLAAIGAVVATVLGYEITGWALVRPSGPTFLDYLEFAGLSAVAATVGALPGLVIVALTRKKADV